MKRFLLLFLVAALLLAGSAAADPVDLSGMTFDQLVALRDQLNLAIWNSQEWQEVTVPAGVYTVGKDIPAGHWSIKATGEYNYFFIYYTDGLDTIGHSPNYLGSYFQQQIMSEALKESGLSNPTSIDIDMKDGWFFISDGEVVFTPYTGKPDLGFK